MKSLVRSLSLLAASFFPVFAVAQTSVVGGVSSSGGFLGISFGSGFFCGSTLCGVAQNILYIINNILVPLLFAVAFIVFLWGVFMKYIYSGGDPDKVSEGHRLILWGLIGFAVMVSLWGLVNVVTNTFGLSGSYAPPLPRSY